MSKEQPNYPLHGITLEMIVTRLVDHYGWEKLGGQAVPMRDRYDSGWEPVLARYTTL